MEIKAMCERCNFIINVNSSIIKREEFVDDKGKLIWLTSYDCPECGKRHYVQIDDFITLSILNECSRMMAYVISKKKNGKDIPNLKSKKFKEIRENLSSKRKDLMQEYSGKTLINSKTKERAENLRFSV